MRKIPITLLVLLFAASGLMAQTTRQEELYAAKDSHLMDAFGGGTNKGLGGMFYWEDLDTVLYQWDVSGITIAATETIHKAEIELFSCDIGPYAWQYQMTAFPMRDPWQEGVGVPTDGYGGKGFPWGPTSVGDATYTWKSVTAVGPGVAPFDTQTVGTAGVAWEVAGALGTTSDCYDRKMMDYHFTGVQGPYPEGVSYGLLPFTGEGLTVVADWIDGSLDNNGLVLAHENTDPAVYCNLRPASRERQTVAGTSPPTLWITIGPHFGDANEDGCVDGLDYVAWSNNYEPGVLGKTWVQGDFDGSGEVDGLDYVMWSNNYNAGVCPPGAIPEPATMALLAIGALALIRRRR